MKFARRSVAHRFVCRRSFTLWDTRWHCSLNLPFSTQFLLGVWAKELNAREDYVKRSVQGKLNSATQKQTESYLRPLFRKLRKRVRPSGLP